MNLYFKDELQCALSFLKAKNVNINEYTNMQINIICQSHNLATYMAGFFAYAKMNTKQLTNEINIISSVKSQNSLYEEIKEEFSEVELNFYDTIRSFSSKNMSKSKKLYLYFIDLNSSQNSNDQNHKIIKNQLQRCLDLAGEQNSSFVFCPSFNFNKPAGENIFAVAEKELEAVVQNDKDFTQGKLLIELEKMCSESFKKHNNFISVVRFDTVFGPFICNKSKLDFDDIIDCLNEKNEICFNKSDTITRYSACYITDAVTAIITALVNGKKANIYNASSYDFSIHELKSILLEKFIETNPKVTYNDDSKALKIQYERLSADKLKTISWNHTISFKDAVYKTACQKMNKQYLSEFYTDIYQGKLDRIKELEMNLIEQVDKICKDNDIPYFLVGGTMLGAVRHGGFIPWDDDIDIGMLREDYDKFRKICAENLGENAFFQYYKNDKQTHYIFDKVRLVDTYFNSELSTNFPKQENGIFIDILVYDKTSNIPLFQKLHIFQVRLLKLVLNILWLDQIKKQAHKTLSKLVLPILKILPFSFYHWCFDKSLSKYKNKKNSKFLIDGVGLNILKGVLPIEWLTQYVDIEFEGKSFKVSKYYKEYLTMLYGENYMDLLPYSARSSGHTVVRLDLGKYIFKQTQNEKISKNDLRGELY